MLFTFNFVYGGNHDAVVAESLGLNTTLDSMLQLPGSKVIDYKPDVTMALDASCRLQCRMNIETRTNTFMVRTNNFPETPDQRLLHGAPVLGSAGIDELHRVVSEATTGWRRELVDGHIVPAILKPLSETIASR